MNDIDKLRMFLEQDAAENIANKRNITKVIKEDIVFDLKNQIIQGTGLIEEYMAQEYWDSKNTRILVLGIPEEVVMDCLSVTCALVKDTPIQQVAGPLGAMLGFDDVFDGVQTATDILDILKKTGLFDLIKIDKRWHVRNYVQLEPETYEYINGCEYLKPMMIKPQKVEKSTQSGHVSFNKSVLLGKTKHHNGELCLDVLNIQNSIPLCLDKGTLDYEEEPKQELSKDALKQFNKMTKRSREIYDEIGSDSFYMCHNYDGRGRLYALGYHVTYQSMQYKRALININIEESIKLD